MFTLEQIQYIHSRVKSGADFPRYIQDLKQLGIANYSVHVDDGRTVYLGKNNESIVSEAQYPSLNVALTASKQGLEHALKVHQQGLSDYMTFCRQAAEAGVDKWTVDMVKMICSYYDRQGKLLVIEAIPG